MAGGQQPKTAPAVLNDLMERGGWTNRKLAAATKERGPREIKQASIGNIRAGRDNGSPATLAYLAEVMGEDPEVFAEVRLAAARCLFDERAIGLEAAQANYERFIAAETPAARAMRQAMEDAAQGQAQGASAGAASPPR